MKHRENERPKHTWTIFFSVFAIAVVAARCTPVAPSISKLSAAPETEAPKSDAKKPEIKTEPTTTTSTLAAIPTKPTSTVPVEINPVSNSQISAQNSRDCVYALPADFSPHSELLDAVTQVSEVKFQWRLSNAEIYGLKNNGAIRKSLSAFKGLTPQAIRAFVRISKTEPGLNTLDEAPIQIRIELDTLTIELSKSLQFLDAIDEVAIASVVTTSPKECPALAKVMTQLTQLEEAFAFEADQNDDLPLL